MEEVESVYKQNSATLAEQFESVYKDVQAMDIRSLLIEHAAPNSPSVTPSATVEPSVTSKQSAAPKKGIFNIFSKRASLGTTSNIQILPAVVASQAAVDPVTATLKLLAEKMLCFVDAKHQASKTLQTKYGNDVFAVHSRLKLYVVICSIELFLFNCSIGCNASSF